MTIMSEKTFLSDVDKIDVAINEKTNRIRLRIEFKSPPRQLINTKTGETTESFEFHLSRMIAHEIGSNLVLAADLLKKE